MDGLPRRRARRPASAATLGDFFTIKRGVATGANAFFILERAEARGRGIPEMFLKPILPGSRRLRQDVIEATATVIRGWSDRWSSSTATYLKT